MLAQAPIPGGGNVLKFNLDFTKALEAFKDWEGLLQTLCMALLSVLLAWLIAKHPRVYGKAATLDEVEQPKTFLMYALVGTVVGRICSIDSTFGLVIFGLGGLFRFRTDVGPARDTGRLILVTLIGICCGLYLFAVAILATAFAWVLIFLLEARVAHKVTIKGLDEAHLPQAAEAYQEVLVENGCAVLSRKLNLLKKQVAFVIRAPKQFEREQLEDLFKDIPPKLQGAPDWESG